MTFMVFGILNTIVELFAFLMNTVLLMWLTYLAEDVKIDASSLDLPITFTILLLAHALCTIIMVCKMTYKSLDRTVDHISNMQCISV